MVINLNNIFITNNLPKPLSQEKLNSLFIEYHEGNIHAKETLIESNIKLVIFIVNKYFDNSESEKEDLVSIGIIGLMKAIDHFDYTKKTKFSTFALKCIKNEILCSMRRKKWPEVSMYEVIGSHDDKDLTIEDTLADDDVNIYSHYEKKIIKDIILAKLDALSNQEKYIILLKFGFINNKIYTHDEVASILNCSKSNVTRIMHKTLKKLKIYLINEDILPKRTLSLLKKTKIN